MTHHHMAWWWRDMVEQWHDHLVIMELVLSWYKMWHHVSLVIQSLLYSTTQQLLNNHPLLYSTMPMLKSHTFQSASGVNTITRPTLRRSGGDYLSGQQVVVTNLSSVDWRLICYNFRSMTWCSQTFSYPRSLRPWEWTITCGFKPSSTMKSWRDLGDRNQAILINDSCGESSGWGWSIQRQEKRLWTPLLSPWGILPL